MPNPGAARAACLENSEKPALAQPSEISADAHKQVGTSGHLDNASSGKTHTQEKPTEQHTEKSVNDERRMSTTSSSTRISARSASSCASRSSSRGSRMSKSMFR